MTLPSKTFLVVALACAASAGCGKLAIERSVLSAAKADSPGCPDEQIHVVGPVEVDGAGLVYEVDVCGRDRFYEDAAPEDGKREFVSRKRPEGVDSNASLWAETDGAEAPAPSQGSGGEVDDFDL